MKDCISLISEAAHFILSVSLAGPWKPLSSSLSLFPCHLNVTGPHRPFLSHSTLPTSLEAFIPSRGFRCHPSAPQFRHPALSLLLASRPFPLCPSDICTWMVQQVASIPDSSLSCTLTSNQIAGIGRSCLPNHLSSPSTYSMASTPVFAPSSRI